MTPTADGEGRDHKPRCTRIRKETRAQATGTRPARPA